MHNRTKNAIQYRVSNTTASGESLLPIRAHVAANGKTKLVARKSVLASIAELFSGKGK